ncbi:immune inhibitor A domain-containing protein [Actinoplanes flavus]|uniref:immune inhibitor A domain-containing protein n=1 Tax=Actinoplanes flavus TaxID=2820290 RepID=UPI0027DE649B|nr:immune inhibitor A domain-containing protein [Actinoplanes flavus]
MGTREPDLDRLTLDGSPLPAASYGPRPSARIAVQTPPVGTVRSWAGLNEIDGDVYRKDYTLRGVGEHIEVWVAKDIAFPENDCRKNSTEITDAQVTALVREFDEVIYPRETKAFSTPPDRNGTNPGLPGDFTGTGNRTVTLVDNIRDDNYYEFPEHQTYVSGFFSEQLNELFDRNVITIDAYDWEHRTGANPKHEPNDDVCISRPARPRMYESTFAHEWQHLLSYYTDPDEEVWINEGLADYAQTLTGYVDSRIGVYHRGFDNHIVCYQGFGNVKTDFNPNPRECGGPANSLNLWSEGTPDELLADYGQTYQLMLYLSDRFGAEFHSKLHQDKEHHGLDAIAAALPSGTKLYDVLHDFQVMTLVDKVTDEAGSILKGASRDRVTSASVHSTVNLDNPSAYGSAGAPPNGADYVRLPRGWRTVVFDGARTLPPTPLAWTLDAGKLFSGDTPDTDEGAVRFVDIPQTDAVLRFKTTYGLEDRFDYGYVMVSADGGKTYQMLESERTVKGPLGPAITGKGTDVTLSYDLKAYAGKRVLLGFRYVSDSAVNIGGWHISEVKVGATELATDTLEGWKSPTEVHPTPVHDWHVSLVGLDAGKAKVVSLDRQARVRHYPKVVAVISYDEPTGTVTHYAPYTLKVDGKPYQPAAGNQDGGSTP